MSEFLIPEKPKEVVGTIIMPAELAFEKDGLLRMLGLERASDKGSKILTKSATYTLRIGEIKMLNTRCTNINMRMQEGSNYFEIDFWCEDLEAKANE